MKMEMIAAIACTAAMAHGATVKHVIKPARFTRGNTAILPVQPIDQAAWFRIQTSRTRWRILICRASCASDVSSRATELRLNST